MHQDQVEIGPEGRLLAPVGPDSDQRDTDARVADQLIQPRVRRADQFAPKGRPDQVGPAPQLIKLSLDRDTPICCQHL